MLAKIPLFTRTQLIANLDDIAGSGKSLFRGLMDANAGKKVTTMRSAARDKRTKFVELAERRTVNAIRSIRVIGKLGNPFAYDYNESDIKKIVSALNKEVDDLRLKMMKKGGKASVEFKL